MTEKFSAYSTLGLIVICFIVSGLVVLSCAKRQMESTKSNGQPAVVEQGDKILFRDLSIQDEIMLRQAIPSQEKIKIAIQKLRAKGIGSDLGNDFSELGTQADCGPACENCCGMCETCNVWDDGSNDPCVRTCRIHCCC